MLAGKFATANYVGRFAPSPTGPLHFGSLIAAVASYCDAKANNGKWLLRIEDIDQPREMPGAADDILRTLEGFGFAWDGEVVVQSQRHAHYEKALQQLQQLVYPCTCSRKEIADSSNQMGFEGHIYPKTCFNQPCFSKPKVETSIHAAFRVKTTNEPIIFTDAIQGDVHQKLATDIGDFVLKRADGYFAYQLAVVVDDAAQGITHIVRGADLLNSTPRQIYLQQLLGFATPNYAHVPIAVNKMGEKLSKQTLAEPISMRFAGHQLLSALQFLGQHPPIELQNAALSELWAWAITHWQMSNIPRVRAIAN